MILEKDADLNHIERSGIYNGLYFVLGGTLPMRDDSPETIRIHELAATLKEAAKGGLSEVVLALGLTPEGDYTTHFLVKRIRKIIPSAIVKVTVLGRGLSVGSELEYSDKETLRHALGSRKEDA
jgi:recombination protein RecR